MRLLKFSISSCSIFVNCVYQVLYFMSLGFSRQEYWSGLLFPPPGDLPDPGIKILSPLSPALASGFFTTRVIWEYQGKNKPHFADVPWDHCVTIPLFQAWLWGVVFIVPKLHESMKI